jgi:phosphate transport system permease protein
MSDAAAPNPSSAEAASGTRASSPGVRLRGRRQTFTDGGETWLWLAGGALSLALLMIVGLLFFIAVEGLGTFWPQPLVLVETSDSRKFLGDVFRTDVERSPGDGARPPTGARQRTLYRTANEGMASPRFQWASADQIKRSETPEWGVVIETRGRGRLHAIVTGYRGEAGVRSSPAEAIAAAFERRPTAEAAYRQAESLRRNDLRRLDERLGLAEKGVRHAAFHHGEQSPEADAARGELAKVREEISGATARMAARIDELLAPAKRELLLLETAAGEKLELPVGEIVRLVTPNRLGTGAKLLVYLDRWREFLLDWPRAANAEGGILPAIWGTVTMTLIMSIAVVPFGVLAALYLREYAKSGPVITAVRIAINNLAGVPSIVFGIFGFGFFCYAVGGSIDRTFFPAELSYGQPTWGKEGLIWASFTLALLTLPVVIVATEEALAAVPNSMREGSYACGAGKWQTIRRIVLPRALPGIMTGMILAIARGAGEVAPLMLVGVVKSAENLPVDGSFPYVHPTRSFMHLGFHIFDLGFHSPDSDGLRPMLFSTTLVLIATVAGLNLTAVAIRNRLRRRYESSKF